MILGYTEKSSKTSSSQSPQQQGPWQVRAARGLAELPPPPSPISPSLNAQVPRHLSSDPFIKIEVGFALKLPRVSLRALAQQVTWLEWPGRTGPSFPFLPWRWDCRWRVAVESPISQQPGSVNNAPWNWFLSFPNFKPKLLILSLFIYF